MKKSFDKEFLSLDNIDILNSKNVVIILVALIPLLNAGYDHDIIYWLLFISLPILIIVSLKNKDNFIIEFKSPNFFIVLLIIWSFVSIFWSINYVRSIIEWFQLFSYILVFFLIQKISEEDIDKLIKIVHLTGLGIAVFGILEYIFVAGRRIVSTFPNPNPLGIYLAMLFLFTFGLSLRKNESVVKANKYDVYALIFGTALILTGSRGSYVAFLIGLPFIFIGNSKEKLFRNIVKTFLTIVLSVIFANIVMILASQVQNIIFSKSLFESMTRVDSFVPSSLKGRLEFWKVGFDLIRHRPLNGFGLGSFFSAYYIEYNGNEWYSRFAHNHYLQTVVEIGFIGLSLLVGFIFSSIYITIKKIKNKQLNIYIPGAIAASIAFLAHIGVDFSWNFPGVTLLFFAFMGIIVSSKNNAFLNSKGKKGINISYKLIALILSLILVFTLWHFSSNKILEKGLNHMEEYPDTALEYFELGNKIYPINSMGFYFESKLYFDKYKDSEKMEFLEKSLELSQKSVNLTPYDSLVLNNLGNIYWEKGQLDNAEKYLSKASRYGAYILSNYIDLGKFYIEDGNLEKAEEVLINSIKYIDYSIRRAPKDEKPIKKIEGAVIHNLLGRIYKEWNDIDKLEYHKRKEKELLKEAFEEMDK